MTADILPFRADPAAPIERPVDAGARPRLEPGDMVVCCVNATLSLWCAWPVAVVDDDGVVLGVRNAAGKLLGVDRLNCQPEVYGFRAADHDASPFLGLRWKTWRDPGEAVLEFARIGAARGP